ncbi:Hypothetical predicted protein [Pelobates cultripes]|uniref:Uncharacterized protein n=1 Tax=Pelobates cultripes TaxID=61616 RepID=A0AAD1RXD1_PELCU|nr:Hypothetical predicted protein [Pelobates cultripes]
MASDDRASRPPPAQPLPAQLASGHPQEDRIAAAFNLFWTRWQTILAQNRATTVVTQLSATSSARVPALKSITMPPTNITQQKATRAPLNPNDRRPSTRYRKPGYRRARRATTHSLPPHKLKWCTRGAYARPTPDEAKKACQRSTHKQ